jgi:hypothetical protein
MNDIYIQNMVQEKNSKRHYTKKIDKNNIYV